MNVRLSVVAVLLLLVSACAPKTPNTAGRADDLGVHLDCLRERNLAVVAAHRGQPDQSAAENVISSFTASLAAGVPFLEIDVATTKDGVLVLMHDDTLDRTTTGSGAVVSRSWSEIQAARVKRPDGTVLDERVPRFADVLAWGRKAGAYFEVDVKKTTRFSDVVEAVRASRMESRVLIVHVHPRRCQGRARSRSPADALRDDGDAGGPGRRAGGHPARPHAGVDGHARPAAQRPFAALRAAGIEPIFGTLGRPGERLDDAYLEDGNPSDTPTSCGPASS